MSTSTHQSERRPWVWRSLPRNRNLWVTASLSRGRCRCPLFAELLAFGRRLRFSVAASSHSRCCCCEYVRSPSVFRPRRFCWALVRAFSLSVLYILGNWGGIWCYT